MSACHLSENKNKKYVTAFFNIILKNSCQRYSTNCVHHFKGQSTKTLVCVHRFKALCLYHA